MNKAVKIIRSRMIEQGYSQAEFARRVGVTSDAISKYFSDKRDPTCTTLQRMGEAVGLNIYYTEGWIDVNDQLPPLKQHVLLSCYGRAVYGRLIEETGNDGYPIFQICDSVGEGIVRETTAHGEMSNSRIKAWMPLPEPFKGKEITCK